jgi:DnaJ-class molecular chaperone
VNSGLGLAENPYNILEVNALANSKEIKRAYRRLIRKYHPDIGGHRGKQTNKLRDVIIAYKFLSDAEKRKQFDAEKINMYSTLHQKPFTTDFINCGEEGGDECTIKTKKQTGKFLSIKTVFSLLSRMQGLIANIVNKITQRDTKEPDMLERSKPSYGIEVGFLEAIRGGRRKINMPDGRIVLFSLPSGICDGQIMRLQSNAENANPIYIQIHVRPHPHLKRKGQDIHIDVPVNKGEMKVGKMIQIPTIFGNRFLKVLPGTVDGCIFKIENCGVAGGNQYVRVLAVDSDREKPLTKVVMKVKKKSIA